MADRYDVIVIGGGPGGYPAAVRAAQLGRRVAVVEGDKLGGVCLHRGCIPTKVMLHAGDTLRQVRRGAAFGLQADRATLDYGKLLAYRAGVVDRLHRGVQGLMRRWGITVVAGWGMLAAPTCVEVVNDAGKLVGELEADDVILATGSRPRGLSGLEFDGVRVLSSDHALAQQELPQSMVIVGAGAVGTEFASFYASAGVQEVTLVEFLPRVLPMEDPEVSREVEAQLRAAGVSVLTGARVLPETFQPDDHGFACEVLQDGRTVPVAGAAMLVAVGRDANTEHLGLDELGVQRAGGFVRVDGFMRTTVPHVYAVGDVVGGPLLAHKASAEGVVAAETIAGREVAPVVYSRVPRCTFSHPEVASFGLTEEEAVAQGRSVTVGRFPTAANSRATVEGEHRGFVKVIMDSTTEEILGFHAVGPRVTELISGPLTAALLEGTPYEVATAIHPHPTLTESIREAAAAVFGMATHG